MRGIGTGAATIGALLLAGCGDAASNSAANGPATANAPLEVDEAKGDAPRLAAPALPPPAPAPDLEGARVLLGQIYMPYTRGEIPRLGAIYTPELQAAIRRQSDDGTGLGYDPFCQCQDFDDFTYAIQSVEPAAGGAAARVAISNMGERRVIPIRLAYRGDSWLVADIGEGRESLLNGGD